MTGRQKSELIQGRDDVVLTIDVAHPPMPPHRVEEILTEGLSRVRTSSRYRVLKIIHGYGSSGTGGQTKIVALNWTHVNRRRMRAVMSGESFTLQNPEIQRMKLETGFHDMDLDMVNPGITVCWVK
jgi:hypothetical protein